MNKNWYDKLNKSSLTPPSGLWSSMAITLYKFSYLFLTNDIQSRMPVYL